MITCIYGDLTLTGLRFRGPFLEGPEKFSCPESRDKNVNLTFPKLFFSHNCNTNKVNFHAKFNAYTLLSFSDTDH